MPGRLIPLVLLVLWAPAHADSIVLRFDWPEVRDLRVESDYSHDFLNTAHSHSSHITAHRLLTIEKVADRFLLTYQLSDFAHDMQPEAADIGSDIIDIVTALTLEQPALYLGPAGGLSELADFRAFRQMLNRRLDRFLAELDHQRAMPDIIEYFDEQERLDRFVRPAVEKALAGSLDQTTLDNNLRAFFYAQGHAWHDRILVSDRPLTQIREQRWPVFNETPLAFRETLEYQGRTPCRADEEIPRCVRLHYQARPEPTALDEYLRSATSNQVTIADVTIQGRLTSANQIVSLTLIAEADGLIPHRVIHEMESRAVLLGADGREMPMRELKRARHTYHW